LRREAAVRQAGQGSQAVIREDDAGEKQLFCYKARVSNESYARRTGVAFLLFVFGHSVEGFSFRICFICFQFFTSGHGCSVPPILRNCNGGRW